MLYSAVLVAFTLAVGLSLGPIYTVAAAVLGAVFLGLAWRLRRRADAAPRRRPLPLLARVPRPALRRGRRSIRCSCDRRSTPELERKNLLLGWALFGIFLLLFAGTIGVALLYLAFD